MSVFEKYKANLVDFKDYRKGSIRNLTYTTNNQNHTALLTQGGLFCGKGKTQSTIIPNDIQAAFARDPFVMFACFKSFDDLGVHHIYSAYGTGSQPRIIFRRYPTNTNNINIVDSAGNSVFSSSITVQNREKVCIIAVIVPSSNLAYVYKNGVLNHTTNIATLVGNFSITSDNTIGPGVGRATDMNDILYYNGMYKNLNLTATEVAQLTSELEAMPDQRASSRMVSEHDGVKGDGTTASSVINYGQILPMGTDDITLEAEILMPHNKIWTTGATAWPIAGKGYLGLAEGRFYFLIINNLIYFAVEFGGIAVSTSAAASASSYNGQKLKLRGVVDRSDKISFYINDIVATSASIAAYAALNVQGTLDFTIGNVSGGPGYTKLPFPGKISNVKVYRNGVLEFFAPCYNPASLKDNAEGIVPIYSSSVFTFDGVKNIVTPEIHFKGEMGAIANETTVSSGYLENTGAQVLSGSFKMVTEKNNNKLEKVITCVTDGSIYIPQSNAALTGWTRYIDTGGGYEPFTTDLATARTIPLIAGRKLIWASEDANRSLRQQA